MASDRTPRAPRKPARRRLARFNRVVANRVVGPVLTRLPGFGALHHRGRRSGRAYATPVKIFRNGENYVFSLPYGPESDWVKNAIAAGGCELVTRGRRVRLVEPKVYVDRGMTGIPKPIGAVLRRLHAFDFVEMRVGPESE